MMSPWVVCFDSQVSEIKGQKMRARQNSSKPSSKRNLRLTRSKRFGGGCKGELDKPVESLWSDTLGPYRGAKPAVGQVTAARCHYTAVGAQDSV